MEEQKIPEIDFSELPVDQDMLFDPFFTGQLLTDDESKFIIDWFDTHQHLITVGGETQYNGIRYMHIFNPQIRNILDRVVFNLIGQIRRVDSTPVYPEMVSINRWHVGGWQDPHLDTYSSQEELLLDHDPSLKDMLSLKSRLWTTIIPLNDDYRGGRTYIPPCDTFPEGYTHEPAKGHGFVFQGIYYEHGVEKVRRAPRYTIAMWFTQDPFKMQTGEPTKDLNLNEDTQRLQTFGYNV
jgi:hypothetical protein